MRSRRSAYTGRSVHVDGGRRRVDLRRRPARLQRSCAEAVVVVPRSRSRSSARRPRRSRSSSRSERAAGPADRARRGRRTPHGGARHLRRGAGGAIAHAASRPAALGRRGEKAAMRSPSPRHAARRRRTAGVSARYRPSTRSRSNSRRAPAPARAWRRGPSGSPGRARAAACRSHACAAARRSARSCPCSCSAPEVLRRQVVDLVAARLDIELAQALREQLQARLRFGGALAQRGEGPVDAQVRKSGQRACTAHPARPRRRPLRRGRGTTRAHSRTAADCEPRWASKLLVLERRAACRCCGERAREREPEAAHFAAPAAARRSISATIAVNCRSAMLRTATSPMKGGKSKLGSISPS